MAGEENVSGKEQEKDCFSYGLNFACIGFCAELPEVLSLLVHNTNLMVETQFKYTRPSFLESLFLYKSYSYFLDKREHGDILK